MYILFGFWNILSIIEVTDLLTKGTRWFDTWPSGEVKIRQKSIELLF